MIELKLDEKEVNNLIVIMDAAQKAAGIQLTEAVNYFINKIKEASPKQEEGAEQAGE